MTLHSFLCKVHYGMCTPLMMIWAKLLGKVEFSRFYSCGLFHIFLHKNSYLSIGENCHFMSKSWGNRLGLYHRCILSTEPGARIIIGKNCGLSGVTIRCFTLAIMLESGQIPLSWMEMHIKMIAELPKASQYSSVIMYGSAPT